MRNFLVLLFLLLPSICWAQSFLPDEQPRLTEGLLLKPSAAGVALAPSVINGTMTISGNGVGASTIGSATSATTLMNASTTDDVDIASVAKIAITTSNITLTPAATVAGIIHFTFMTPADTTMTLGTNVEIWNINANGVIRQHATGALALQTDYIFGGATDSFVAASTLTLGATMELLPKTCGTNGTCTNETSLYIPTAAVTATNSYGIYDVVTTGATRNYAAYLGGSVGIGTVTPLDALDVGGANNGAVAIGSAYAGITAAPANGLIVQGNVGIGTAIPQNQLDFWNGASEAFYVDSSNLVHGISFVPAGGTQISAGSALFTSPAQFNDLGIRGNGSRVIITTNVNSTPNQFVLASTGLALGTAASNQGLGVYGGGVAVGTYASSATSAVGIGSAVFSGWVGIGTSVTPSPITVAGLSNTATTSALCWNTVTGAVTYDGTIGSCNTSDENLKVIDKTLTDGLDKILSLHPVYFHWKDPRQYGEGERIGFMAQDVEKFYPELVATDGNGFKSLAYDKLTAPLISAVQEQQKEIDDLRKQLNMPPRTCNVFCRVREWFEGL